jgi:peptide/nickel transport system permease protein
MISRVVDVVLTVPGLLLVLLIMTAFGTRSWVLVVAITSAYAPAIYRVLRGAAMSTSGREYVLAARARGDSAWWIASREILPNLGPTLSVEFALRLTWAIMFFAALSFLGLGVQPPTSNWGVMVGENRQVIFQSPLAVIAPGVAIALLVLSVNLIADAFAQYFSVGSAERVIL